MNICSIYKITNNVNGKIYIGQTWISIKERFRKHTHISSNCLKIKRAIDKYGKNNFQIKLITVCSTQKVADHLESYFIEKYDSVENGYNILIGGKTGSRKGIKTSDETKVKLSKAACGRKHSDETKLKLSRLNKNKIFSKEHRSKLSKAKAGMTWKIVNGKRVWCKNE